MTNADDFSNLDSNESVTYPCYSIKIFKDRDLVQTLLNKKIQQSFKLSSFPTTLNLNDVATISSLIAVLRDSGATGLQKKYNLKTVK